MYGLAADETRARAAQEANRGGDLFGFTGPSQRNCLGSEAFSVFAIDNTIYTNMLPSGQSFVLSNGSSFITVYPEPPPHGTPIPWLRSYGFTSDYEAAELSDPNTNGMPVWQEYIAGLDPLDTNSTLDVWPAFTAGETPQILFSTVNTCSKAWIRLPISIF